MVSLSKALGITVLVGAVVTTIAVYRDIPTSFKVMAARKFQELANDVFINFVLFGMPSMMFTFALATADFFSQSSSVVVRYAPPDPAEESRKRGTDFEGRRRAERAYEEYRRRG